VKMSTNWEVIGTWRTRTSPTATLSLNGVDGEVYGTDVVTVDQSDPRQGVVQLHMQLLKPTRLYHTVGHDAVLRLALEREMMF
jgi:hypothetical protein